MVIQHHLSSKAIGVLSQDVSLVSQLQSLVPELMVFHHIKELQQARLDVLLIDDEVDKINDHIDTLSSLNCPTIILIDTVSNLLDDALASGITDYIPKPLSSRLLIHRLRQHIERSTSIANHHHTTHYNPYNRTILLDRLTDAVVSTDINFVITSWNKSAEHLYGWRAEEVIGQRLQGLLPTIYINAVREDVVSILQSGETWQGELIQSNKFGEKKHVLASSSCVFDESGELQGYVSITHDITDREAMSLALQQSNQRLELIYNHLPIMVISFSASGTILRVNQRTLEDTHYHNKDMIGKHLDTFLTLRSAQLFRHKLSQKTYTDNTLANVPLQMICTDNRIIDVVLDVIPVTDGDNINFNIGVLRNMTQQREVEETLVNTETEYQSILASMTDPIFVFNSEGTYCRIPQITTNNYFLDPKKLLNKRLHDIFPTELADRFVDTIQKAIETQSTQIIEYDLPIQDRRTYFSAVVNAISGRDEVVWVARDITRAKLNELALRETEKRYRQLFENANDMIVMVESETGRILDANMQIQKQLGYTRQELIRLNITDIEEPLQDSRSRIMSRTLATSGHIIFEQTYRGKGGKTIPVETSTRLIDHQGRKVLLSFARNITQRKLAMQAEAEERFFAEALRDTVSQLARALTVNEVLDLMLSTVKKVVDTESSNIMLIEGDTARVIRTQGYHDPISHPIEVHIPSTFTLRHMRETQQAIIISDVDEDPRWIKFSDDAWSKSYVGAPIVLKDETIGYINLDSRIPHFFTNKHRQRLQAFADQSAIAIENARLYEASQQYTEDLEARVTERTIELTRANEELTEQIARRKKAEEELSEERNILRTIIDSLPDTVYVKDRQSRFVLVNRFPFLLVDEQPIIGKSDLDLIKDKSVARARYEEEQKLMQTGETYSREEYVITESGEEQWIIRTKVPFRDESGEIAGLVGVNQNVTQIKLAERQLRQLLSSAQCLLWFAVVDYEGDTFSWTINIENEDSAKEFLPFDTTNKDYTQAWLDNIVEEDQSLRETVAHTHLQQNLQSYKLEYRCLTMDGREHWLSEDVQVRQLTPTRWHLIGVSLDISDIKFAEIALRESHDQMERRVIERTAKLREANAELQQEILVRQQAEDAERQQRILAEALQDSITALNNTLNIDDVLDAVLSAMKLTVEHDATNIMLLEDEDLIIVRQHGYPSPLPQKIPLDSIPDIPIIYQSKKAIIISDTREYEMWDDNTAVHGEVSWIRSNIKIPIIYDDRVVGILLLDSAEPDKFTTEHANLLQTFANQASIALQNARLYQAERQQRLLTETLQDSIKALNNTLDIDEVLDAILDAIQLNVDHEASNIMLIEQDTLKVVRQRGYQGGIPEIIRLDEIEDMKFVRTNKQPFIIDDTRTYDGWMGIGDVAWIRSNIKVPIIHDNEAIGIINLDSSQPNQYTLEDARLLQAFASQASIALQNARLYQQAQADIVERQRAEAAEREQRIFAETLRDTAIALNQQLKTNDLYETVIKAIEQVIKVHDTASIIVMNVDKTSGIVVTDRGFEKFGGSIKGLVLDLQNTSAKRHLIENRQPVWITDTHTSDLWVDIEETAWIRSHLSLPIYVKDEILALINLDSQHPNQFTQEHVDRLIVFSHQVAIALQNARLVEQIQEYNQELESRVQQRTMELENERGLLQIERSQLRAILDAMRDGVYYTDNNHVPIYINNALSEITGYTSEQWLNGRVLDHINQGDDTDRETIWRNIERHLDRHHFWHSETTLSRADGTQFDASLIRTEVKGIDNKRVGIVTVVRDISFQKQLEEQKARFIANAAHELRTPITNIKTRLFLLKHKPEKFTEHLAIAESAANWMQTLVDNLFDHSRFERGIIQLEIEELNLQRLTEVVIETQQPEANLKGINLITKWDEDPIIMAGDRSRLRQVITNLINNAIHYTPEDGNITITLTQEEQDNHPVVVITVQDTGIGIDSKHLPYLFQPFYRATQESKGAGLGLSIAREIIEAHKGTINVESTVGEGTIFLITLPLLSEVELIEEA